MTKSTVTKTSSAASSPSREESCSSPQGCSAPTQRSLHHAWTRCRGHASVGVRLVDDGLAIVGILAVIGGALGQFVAWIGAVLNTSRLADKTWFILLLVLGLVSFGSIAMVVYLVAGPDGTRDSATHTNPLGAAA